MDGLRGVCGLCLERVVGAHMLYVAYILALNACALFAPGKLCKRDKKRNVRDCLGSSVVTTVAVDTVVLWTQTYPSCHGLGGTIDT